MNRQIKSGRTRNNMIFGTGIEKISENVTKLCWNPIMYKIMTIWQAISLLLLYVSY